MQKAYVNTLTDGLLKKSDELAFVIVGVLNAQIFLLKAGGLQGGYCPENLEKLVNLAKEYKVNKIQCESNFGKHIAEVKAIEIGETLAI